MELQNFARRSNIKMVAIARLKPEQLDHHSSLTFFSLLSRPVNKESFAEIQQLLIRTSGKFTNSEPAADKLSRHYRILIAEDNAINQMVIFKILSRAGHLPVVVNNGEEALEYLANEDFDLVFMDINMPVMNGVEACQLYQFSSQGRPLVPIFALTADATPENEVRCREAGMHGCITKPINARELLMLVSNFMEGKPSVLGEHIPEQGLSLSDAQLQATSPIAPVLDEHAINDLLDLGGIAFVSELVDQFIADSAAVLRAVSDAVESNDLKAFLDQAHAMRSSAANVGARGVYELCLSWRERNAGDLAEKGHEDLRRLREEFDAASVELSKFIAKLESLNSSGGKQTGKAA